jgi:GntR family transcriptional regulator, histidine utilization repressor
MTLDQRIRSDIETRIHSGELRPGDRIPFEHELVVQYRCSRATVSKALEGLAKSGLIERRRKAGSFVAHPHVQTAVLEVPDLQKLIADKGEVYRWERITKRYAAAADLSDAALGSAVLLVEGLHHCGDKPFGLETRLISLAAVPLADEQSFADVPPGTWLLQHVPWTRARHAIRAREATPSESEALMIAAGAACLEIERWTWRVDEPVTRVRQLFPGDRYDLVAEFNPNT